MLVLLSWLLPLMALLAAGFLVSLLFTGLAPLWETKSAAALLLAAAATLVVLINAAWQNGPAHHSPPLVLRIGGSAAALALLPLVAIAAYALALRVGQHGWSETRIYAVACVVVAACYAIGYGWASLKGSVLKAGWLTLVAPVNIATSFVVLGVLVALFSPVADPMRIAVASQTARLTSGAIAAAKFDYNYLRYSGGRFGHDALTDLAANAKGPDAALIRERAKAALAGTHRYRHITATPQVMASQLTVYPHDYKLPKTLLEQDWTKEKASGIPTCLTRSGYSCEVFPAALTGSPPDQLIFIWGSEDYWSSAVLGADASGHWSVVGRLSRPHCKPALEALRKGQYEIVPPEPPRFRDVETGAGRFTVEPATEVARCPRNPVGRRFGASPLSAIKRATGLWNCAMGGRVALIDYGSGNLRSAEKALGARRARGREPVTRSWSPPIRTPWPEAERIVLPGVGAFADCMNGVTAIAGMRDALEDAVLRRGVPFLGICVGMQLLATVGREFGETPGLGWIDGEVIRLAPGDAGAQDSAYGLERAEHAAAPIRCSPASSRRACLFRALLSVSRRRCGRRCWRQPIMAGRSPPRSAADNIAGTQFHPEKSQAVGLQLLANFLSWSP